MTTTTEDVPRNAFELAMQEAILGADDPKVIAWRRQLEKEAKERSDRQLEEIRRGRDPELRARKTRNGIKRV